MSIALINPSKDTEPNRRFGDKPVKGVSVIYHNGNDYGWGNGFEVYAAADGEVTVVHHDPKRKTNNRFGGYGNRIEIKHSGGYSTLYAHLPTSAPLVKVGDKVKAGQLIGYMGNTGNAQGIHLHFELRFNGKIIDPNPYISSGITAAEAYANGRIDVTPNTNKGDIVARVIRNKKTGYTCTTGPGFLVHHSEDGGVKAANALYGPTVDLEHDVFITTMYVNMIPVDMHQKPGVRYLAGQ